MLELMLTATNNRKTRTRITIKKKRNLIKEFFTFDKENNRLIFYIKYNFNLVKSICYNVENLKLKL